MTRLLHYDNNGPVVERTHTLEEACQENVGHKHRYDHKTLALDPIRVSYLPNGADFDQEHPERNQWIDYPDLQKGHSVTVLKGVVHKVKALVPNAMYKCIFSHRDFGGLVIESYVGNDAESL